MRISLTGNGFLAEELLKIYPATAYSFRKMSDEEILICLKQTDVLIHNAANTNFDSNFLFEDNFGLTKRIVDLININSLNPLFINIGSMSYLKDESSIKSPDEMSEYSFSKFMSEEYVSHYINNYKLIRFSNIFYKNPEKDGLSKMIYEANKHKIIRLINNGCSKRDWIPINIAILYLLESIKSNFKIINICSGKETSFLEISKIIQKNIPAKIEMIEEKTTNILSKFSLSLSEIHFSLNEEIKNYICEL